MKGVAVALFLFLALAASGVAQVPDDQLIVPGVRIGKWTLNMTILDLVAANGPPLFTATILGGEFTDAVTSLVWKDVEALTRDGRNVYALTARNEQFKTEKGIGYLSPRPAVPETYGPPTATIRRDTRLLYIYVESNISNFG